MSATARTTALPPWELAADEVIRREVGFDQLAYGGKTPLEHLRPLLRRARRRADAYRLAFRVVVVPHAGPKVEPLATYDDTPAIARNRRKGHGVKLCRRMALAVLAVAVAVHLLAPSVTEAAARAVLARLSSSAVGAIDEARACTQARAILDAANVLVDISPVSGCPGDRPFLSAPVAAPAAALMHAAWRAVEGEYRVSPSTISGLNLKGKLRALVQRVNPFREVQTGGSSPIETALKNLRGRPGQARMVEKLQGAFEVLVYTAQRLQGDADRDVLVAEGIPCVRGAEGSGFGYQLAGDLCPLFLFAKTADELDWSERCIWAATAKPLYRAIGPETPAPVAEQSRANTDYIRSRAKICVERVGAQLRWTRQQIDAERTRADTAAFPAGVVARNRGSGAEVANLQEAMPGLVYALRDELKLMKAGSARSTLGLNVSAARQKIAFERVMAAAKKVEPRLAPGLCLSACADDQTQADVAAVLAEIRGDQLAIVQAVTNSHFLLTGPMRERNGAYERAPTHRSVGSTNKAWMIPLLVAGGHTTFCNLVPVGHVNASDGADAAVPCSDGRGMVDLRRATAHSLNSAFADAARKLGEAKTRDLFTKLGFDFDSTLTGAQWFDGLVLGYRVTTAPMVQMRNLAALYRGFRGEEPVSHLPRLTASEDSDSFDWRSVGVSIDILKRAGEVLTAPIQDNDGTLHSLNAVLKRHGCLAAIGKTGTTDSAVSGGVRDKIMMAAFQCKSRRYVAYASIGSPRMDMPLGRIRASDLAQLVDALLSVQENTETKP